MAPTGPIVLCAGELSGDMHAAHVVAELTRRVKTPVVGMAGANCAQAGMDVRFHHRDYAVIGFTGVLAGLPNLVGDVAKAATYAERMFIVSELGPLTPDQVAVAVVEPARELGVEWDAAATEAIVDRSDGFPFFIQTWAYHTWNTAHDEPISAADVARAAPAAEQALDTAFFASRIARIPASEVSYVQALAGLGPGPHRSGEVAEAMGMGTSQVGAFRDRLIGEGVIYAPRYGWVEFAIPHFDQYVRRTTGG